MPAMQRSGSNSTNVNKSRFYGANARRQPSNGIHNLRLTQEKVISRRTEKPNTPDKNAPSSQPVK